MLAKEMSGFRALVYRSAHEHGTMMASGSLPVQPQPSWDRGPRQSLDLFVLQEVDN